MNLGLLILWKMEQSARSWLHGFFLASSEPQNGASAKKTHVFGIMGHAFLGGNQS